MKRMLATTDLSERSDRALRRAVLLAARFSANWSVLHVVDRDQPATVVEQEVAQTRAVLSEQLGRLVTGGGPEPSVEVRAGDPYEVIVECATEVEADIIVMGAHRKRMLRDIFIGTTIERVMRTARRPVLMVNREPSGDYLRVAVAIDPSPASAEALACARSLGLFEDVYLTLFHAFTAPAKGAMIYANVEAEQVEEHIAREAGEVRLELAAFLEKVELGAKQFDVRVVEGAPQPAIRKFVEKDRPDLLIIGTRGLTGARRTLFGSVADALLRGLECDVLAIPSSERAENEPEQG